MSFKTEIRDGDIIGFSFETARTYFFFGTKNLPRNAVAAAFPQYEFAFLKQVHGHAVLNADPSLTPEADAHFTSRKKLALVSQTADCMPVLLSNEETVCAIHSGWRGTAQNIVGAARSAFPDVPPTTAAIGPHILKPSFEVGHDVAQQLLAAAHGQDGLRFPHPDSQKSYFDLTEMVRRQLRKAFGAGVAIEECLFDTVTDPLFHSYRRQKQQADRQYSFVVLKA